MVSTSDILRSANLIILQHEDNAEEYATQKLWEFRQKRDEDAADAWKRIITAMKEVRKLRKE